MKKFLAILICMFLLCSILAACGSEAGSGDKSGEKAADGKQESSPTVKPAENKNYTLKFLSHNYKPWNDMLTKQARAFETENPNIKIEYTTVEHADLNTKLMTAFASGTAPHIMGVYGPWMVDLVKNNWIASAPAFVEEDIRNNCVASAVESATYDGKLYGYVQHIGIPTPIINEEMYQKAGVDIPTTYEELLEANKKLDITDGNGKYSQVGTQLIYKKDGSWNVIHWSNILKAYGVNIISEDGKKTAFNTPEGLEATKIFARLTHSGFIDNSFTLGKSAMEWSGPWQKSFYVTNAPDLKFKAIPPLKGPVKSVSSMYVWFWAVNANIPADEQEWAWRFNQFISNDKNYLELCKEVGFISVRKANLEDASYAGDNWIKVFGETLNKGEIYYSKISGWEKIDTSIGQELERMAVGEQTPEQALANAEKRVNELLAETKQ